MRLRLATADDADAITRVLWDARAAAMPWLPVVHDRADVRGWVQRGLLTAHRVVVAELDGDVVGVSATSPGWLDQLYVAPQAQGQGVGRALLEHAQAHETRRRETGARGGAELQLWTFARNARARRFYAAAGFAEVEHGDGSGNEERTPDVRLVWRPAPAPGGAPGTLQP